jgi:hypothetical protein
MDRWRRSLLDHLLQRRPTRVGELGRLAGSLAVDEAIRAMDVELSPSRE